MKFLRWLFRLPQPKPPCDHAGGGLHQEFWTTEDGTDMVISHCSACGYFDKGPIHAGRG